MESPALSEELQATGDRTRVIFDAARRAPLDALSAAALERFASILGAEAANLALKVLSTGGVYLAGGIPSVVLPFLAVPAFVEAFRRKGRLADIVTRMPISVVICRNAALIGAATRGLASIAPSPSLP